MAVVDDVTSALKTFNKAIDMVLREPVGPKRWRAANNLWLSLSSKHKQIYKEVIAENAVTRQLVDKHGQAVGLSKAEMSDKSLRNALNIPAGAYNAIVKADPDVFKLKSNFKKFAQEFPEYMTRESY